MKVNLMSLEERKFEELCQSLLREEFSSFQPFSPPDQGMDGYDSGTKTLFQVYFPERAPRKDKVYGDLERAMTHGSACQRWVLLLPKNPTVPFFRWLKNEQQPRYPFVIDVWGKTEINRLLQNHPRVKEAYFPSEFRQELTRIARGKFPRAGDAGPGEEVDAEEAASLRNMMSKLAEEDAERTHRKPDYSREYNEFNKHFNLSSYDRLGKAKMQEAERYLEQKLHARRNPDPQYRKAARYKKAVKTVQRKLRIPDARYREILVGLTGKSSTTLMSFNELEAVYRDFQRRDGLAEVRNN